MYLLLKEEILRIDGDARGVAVSCRRGRVWLTQPGDFRDHILDAGMNFTVGRRGRVAMVAMDNAVIALLIPGRMKAGGLLGHRPFRPCRVTRKPPSPFREAKNGRFVWRRLKNALQIV